jgi:hypothetical protein
MGGMSAASSGFGVETFNAHTSDENLLQWCLSSMDETGKILNDCRVVPRAGTE